MIKYMLGRASTGKFRFAVVECDENWHEEEHGYIIQLSYGQVWGKTTLSPSIIVSQTKQKRNWKEQYTLQFNSEVKKFLDKGYIEVEKHPNEYNSEEELSSLFGETVTNQFGIIKPMLAKQFEKVTNQKIFDNEWLASKKLDGVRCLMYWDGKTIHTASRGGEHYDYSTEHLRTDSILVEFFTNNPTVILDGELFRRFVTLQRISGAARMEKDADNEWLQYWIYDMYDTSNPDMIAKDRIQFLKNNLIAPEVDEIEDPHNHPIYLVSHVPVSGWENIEALHDEYVADGYEGVVIRNPNKVYKPNGRTNDMIKVKKYKSEDFLVVGYELGLRGSEDMVFICELEDGRTFKAMPTGDREVKEEYVQNFESKYKGHKVECTYFNYSDDNIPTQPKARTFRFDLE